jgi:hypothetical protein
MAITTLKEEARGGKEFAQESAKTDGMSKGGQTGVGGAPSLNDFHVARGDGYSQESAKTDGLCKA